MSTVGLPTSPLHGTTKVMSIRDLPLPPPRNRQLLHLLSLHPVPVRASRWGVAGGRSCEGGPLELSTCVRESEWCRRLRGQAPSISVTAAALPAGAVASPPWRSRCLPLPCHCARAYLPRPHA